MAWDRLTHNLKPEMLTVYTLQESDEADDGVPPPSRCQWRRREFSNAFWDQTLITGNADVVPPILAYADLMTTTDARNLEAARLIYEQYIAPNLPTT